MDIFVTGLTGFIGSELVRDLIADGSIRTVIALVRAKDGQLPQERLEKVVEYWRKFGLVDDRHLVRLKIIERLDQAAVNVCKDVSHIFHCAAATDFDLPLTIARQSNVFFTQEVCRFAKKLPELKRLVHFSTAFVAGSLNRRIFPNQKLYRFQNNYEKSKRESEQAIQWSGVPFTILRPSIVVGDSRTGYAYRMRVLYSAWRVVFTGHLPRVPVDRRGNVDLIPVDYLIRASRFLATDQRAEKRILHICAGDRFASPVEILQTAHQVFGMPMPFMAPPFVGRIICSPLAQRFLPHELRQIVEKMRWHLPYLGTRGRIFDTQATEELLRDEGIMCPAFAEYGQRLFQFCRQSKWGKIGYVLN